MRVTYQHADWSPEKVKRRYVRRLPTGEYLCSEVGEDIRYNIRQGIVPVEELPDRIRNTADSIAGKQFNYVFWDK